MNYFGNTVDLHLDALPVATAARHAETFAPHAAGMPFSEILSDPEAIAACNGSSASLMNVRDRVITISTSNTAQTMQSHTSHASAQPVIGHLKRCTPRMIHTTSAHHFVFFARFEDLLELLASVAVT